LGGIALLLLLIPFASSILAPIRAVLQPHLHWILWAVIAYLLLSEWPKGTQRAPAGWRRWWDGWRNLVAGMLTFVLSGILGLILLYRTPFPVRAGAHNLLPAFVGLFAVPSVLQNLASRVELPPQRTKPSLTVTPALVVQGALSGAAGGLFAAFFPVVTAGIGGLLAGQATAQRDDRVFLISQGASKVLYYVGALLLFFAPGLHLTRGGMAWMLAPFLDPADVLGASVSPFYFRITAAALVSGVLAFFLLIGMARLASRLVTHVDFHQVNLGTLALLILMVFGWTGWGGLLVCGAATGIGLIPLLYGARRSNCMGVLLLPLALNMAGLGRHVARWLGIV
jgi:putative membrane protein